MQLRNAIPVELKDLVPSRLHLQMSPRKLSRAHAYDSVRAVKVLDQVHRRGGGRSILQVGRSLEPLSYGPRDHDRRQPGFALLA